MNDYGWVGVMVFKAIFKNISAEETGDTEKSTDLSKVTDKLYSKTLYQVRLAMSGFKLTTLVVTCTDGTGRCKSNYHTITTMMVSFEYMHR